MESKARTTEPTVEARKTEAEERAEMEERTKERRLNGILAICEVQSLVDPGRWLMAVKGSFPKGTPRSKDDERLMATWKDPQLKDMIAEELRKGDGFAQRTLEALDENLHRNYDGTVQQLNFANYVLTLAQIRQKLPENLAKLQTTCEIFDLMVGLLDAFLKPTMDENTEAAREKVRGYQTLLRNHRETAQELRGLVMLGEDVKPMLGAELQKWLSLIDILEVRERLLQGQAPIQACVREVSVDELELPDWTRKTQSSLEYNLREALRLYARTCSKCSTYSNTRTIMACLEDDLRSARERWEGRNHETE